MQRLLNIRWRDDSTSFDVDTGFNCAYADRHACVNGKKSSGLSIAASTERDADQGQSGGMEAVSAIGRDTRYLLAQKVLPERWGAWA